MNLKKNINWKGYILYERLFLHKIIPKIVSLGVQENEIRKKIETYQKKFLWKIVFIWNCSEDRIKRCAQERYQKIKHKLKNMYFLWLLVFT